ncbi:glycoside hydrolase family 26 protein [Cellulomonas endophytica]|uniref:glycoside hydrolase family 26 protein n=1 Tax=Cellulomonas endophytica TaxID=2494735 RepID=UPI0010132DCF|nr:glycosyl hydrolase [Cellulomonas endophytica]
MDTTTPARRLRRGLSTALAAVLAVGGVLATTTSATAAVDPDTRSGVYVGARDLTKLAAFETWRGAKAGIATDFLDSTSWTSLTDPWVMNGWNGKGYQIALAAPMLPADTTTTIQKGATGAYDAYWKKIATNLVNARQSNAVVRIGWEMNGDWFRWSALKDPVAYTEYWRKIVTAMRSVPGQAFLFEWAPNVGGPTGWDNASAYPGDAYVDLIGMSLYDQNWGLAPEQSAERWAQFVTMKGGLEWSTDFAKAHGKKNSIAEWGLAQRCDGHGGGDDVYFINQLDAWIDAHDYYYESYFDRNPNSCEVHTITGGPFPLAREAYKARFLPDPEPTTPTGPSTAEECPPGTVPVDPMTALVKVSTTANRANGVVLDGSTLTGKVYVFATPDFTPLQITWYVDDPQMQRTPYSTEKTAPWDLAGGTATAANAFDVTALAPGQHTITVKYATALGSKYSQVTFTR